MTYRLPLPGPGELDYLPSETFFIGNPEAHAGRTLVSIAGSRRPSPLTLQRLETLIYRMAALRQGLLLPMAHGVPARAAVLAMEAGVPLVVVCPKRKSLKGPGPWADLMERVLEENGLLLACQGSPLEHLRSYVSQGMVFVDVPLHAPASVKREALACLDMGKPVLLPGSCSSWAEELIEAGALQYGDPSSALELINEKRPSMGG